MITTAKLRMAHANTYGARKPPGPKLLGNIECGPSSAFISKQFTLTNKSFYFQETQVLVESSSQQSGSGSENDFSTSEGPDDSDQVFVKKANCYKEIMFSFYFWY